MSKSTWELSCQKISRLLCRFTGGESFARRGSDFAITETVTQMSAISSLIGLGVRLERQRGYYIRFTLQTTVSCRLRVSARKTLSFGISVRRLGLSFASAKTGY
jgi:hypothetical protein